MNPKSNTLKSILRGRKGDVRPDEEAVLIDEPGKPTSDQRPDPVDPVFGPVPAPQRRPEGPGRVHRGTGEGPAGEDVSPDYEPSEDWALGLVGPLIGVDDGGIRR